MERRTMVQSFDWRTLQVVQKEAPEIRTMYLTSPRTLAPGRRAGPRPGSRGSPPSSTAARPRKAVNAAGGKIWAPNQTFLTPAMLAEARALGIVVIPWTVNEPAMMGKLLDMGVDGIISDRPDLVQIEAQEAALTGGKPVIPVLMERMLGAHACGHSVIRRSRSALAITDTELRLIAALAIIGDSSSRRTGRARRRRSARRARCRRTRRTGSAGCCAIVARDSRRARTMPRRSPFTSVMPRALHRDVGARAHRDADVAPAPAPARR